MTQRTLPTGPDEIFRLAEPVLTQVFGKGAYRLGGGTALAAVWQHRHSTDIDLFTEDNRLTLCDELARLPQDWIRSPHTGRPLINAALPVELAQNPALCVDVVGGILNCGPGRLERFWLHSILSCASIRELRNLLYFEGLPLCALVRAAHVTGAISHRLCDSLNQFAQRPAE